MMQGLSMMGVLNELFVKRFRKQKKTKTKTKQRIAKAYLSWYFSLPIIRKLVGTSSKYRGGTVRHIDFFGECTVVWVEYTTMTKAYSYK